MDNLKRVINDIEGNASIKAKFNPEQIEFLKEKARENPPIWDKKVFMAVVYIVGGALFLSIILGAFSVFPIEYNTVNGQKEIIDKEINNFFVMIASASIGALAGLLVPKPSNE